jgi:hypothetical protein
MRTRLILDITWVQTRSQNTRLNLTANNSRSYWLISRDTSKKFGLICGRWAIGLLDSAPQAKRIANPLQDTILPHNICENALGARTLILPHMNNLASWPAAYAVLMS